MQTSMQINPDKRLFGKKTPAATQVAVSALGRPEWLIEVEAIAVR